MAVQQAFSPSIGTGLAFSSLALLYSLMLIGVYVTSSHLGLTCPDWPLCPNGFGWPADRFFFEQLHRLVAAITAGFIISTAVYFRHAPPARKTAAIAAVLVCVQIGFGAVVVYSKLNPFLVAAHLSTGIALFAMALMTFLASYRMYRGAGTKLL
ncbi:MAG: COX15/CtaA family protein [Nitrososphaera sp.]